MIQYDTSRTPSQNSPGAIQDPNSKLARKRLWFWRVITFVLPLLVVGVAIGGFVIMGTLKPEPEKKAEDIKAIPVLITQPVLKNVTLSVEVQGEVQPRTQINVVPQVGGILTYMSPDFIEGGAFKKGDLLARINPADYTLRVTQARAAVAQSKTTMAREKSEASMARSDWEDLGRQGQPTPLTFRQPQLEEAKAQMDSAEARLAEAELQLARTSLYAPFSGRVTQRHIDQGEFVTAGTRLGEIYASNVMDVRLPMTNENLRRAGISIGHNPANGNAAIPVTLSADVGGVLSQWSARIVRTDSRFDSQNRVLFAYAEVKKPFELSEKARAPLVPGIFVNAAITGQSFENALIIPRAALRGDDKVYIAKNGLLSIQTVSVLSTDKDSAVIASGVSTEDNVITSPIRGVANGMKIAVVKTGQSHTPASNAGDE